MTLGPMALVAMTLVPMAQPRPVRCLPARCFPARPYPLAAPYPLTAPHLLAPRPQTAAPRYLASPPRRATASRSGRGTAERAGRGPLGPSVHPVQRPVCRASSRWPVPPQDAGTRPPPATTLLAATVSSATHAKRDRECPGTDSAAAAEPGFTRSGGTRFPGPASGAFPLAGGRKATIAATGRAREEVRAASVVLLPCVPSSVAVARGRIGAELHRAGLSTTAMADAALVTSELLSNAILHARPLPDACIRVSWILSATAVEIIVSDGGSATRPRASRPSVSSIGGRGLGIVEHLCSRWGVRADERGTTVWAVVPASRDGSAGPGGGGPGGRAAAAGQPMGGPAAAEGATRRMDRAGRIMDSGPSRANRTKHATGQPAAQAAVIAQ
jgi:anti-sigma regulatory factor (Ser/Thr protein kinase)